MQGACSILYIVHFFLDILWGEECKELQVAARRDEEVVFGNELCTSAQKEKTYFSGRGGEEEEKKTFLSSQLSREEEEEKEKEVLGGMRRINLSFFSLLLS